MNKIKFSKSALELIKRCNEINISLFAVGGCIRDTAMNMPISDIDFATPIKAEEVMRKLDVYYRTIPTGLAHGTVSVVVNTEIFEITTFRTDLIAIDNRHALIQYANTIEDDLSRRDFTINAIAYDCCKEVYVDPYGGFDDIKNKVLRTVGNPSIRFKEDYLRILRGFRFAAKYNLSIEEQTKRQMCKLLKENVLCMISQERKQAELIKIFSLKTLDDEQLTLIEPMLFSMIPSLGTTPLFDQKNPYHDLSLWEHIKKSIVMVDTVPQFKGTTHEKCLIRLALLYHDIGKITTQTFDIDGIAHYYEHETESALLCGIDMRKYRFSKKDTDMILTLVKNHSYQFNGASKKSMKRLINKVSEEYINSLLIVMYADAKAHIRSDKKIENILAGFNTVKEILEAKEALTVKDLKISGKDVIDVLGLKGPDKIVGTILTELLELVLEEQIINGRSVLLLYVEYKYKKSS